MGIFDFILTMSTIQDFIQVTIYSFGALSVLLFLIIGVFALLPSVISFARKTKGKWIVLVLNIVSPILLFINSTLPTILWLVLIIYAIVAKRKLDQYKIQNINIQSHKNQD